LALQRLSKVIHTSSRVELHQEENSERCWSRTGKEQIRANVLARSSDLSQVEVTTLKPPKRGGIAGLPLFETLLKIF